MYTLRGESVTSFLPLHILEKMGVCSNLSIIKIMSYEEIIFVPFKKQAGTFVLSDF